MLIAAEPVHSSSTSMMSGANSSSSKASSSKKSMKNASETENTGAREAAKVTKAPKAPKTAKTRKAIAANVFAGQPMEDLPQVMVHLSQAGDGVARVLNMLHLAMSGSINEAGCEAAVQSVIAFAAGKPYFDLADYMGRTWLVEPADGRPYNARVHKVMRSDHDRCLHDHPWHNASIVLKGGYWEVLPGVFQETIEFLHESPSGSSHSLPGHIPLTMQRSFELVRSAGHVQDVLQEVQRLNDLIQLQTADKLLPADVSALAEMNVVWRGPLSYTKRMAKDCHRLVIPKDQPAWSLFVMRPKVCEWGFITPDGWVHNEPYLKAFGKDA